MVKRVSLIDVDSKYPNLALMKISAYHKQKGDIAGLNLKNPDRIYKSIVFKKNKNKAKQKNLHNIKTVVGGSGFDFDSVLPDAMEYLCPDYNLYPSEYSQGFTTRGCNRNCYFCFVPRKEGRFKIVQHPKEFYDDRFKTMMILDNNIFFDRDWFLSIAQWSMDVGVKIDMTQGYDIRLLDDELLGYVLDIRDKNNRLKFAFDDSNLKDIIIEKIDLMKSMGVNTHSDLAFYCYCDNDSMYQDCKDRCNLLKSLDVKADPMWNCDIPKTERVKILLKWAWRPQLYWSIDLDEYSKLLHT